MNWMLALLLVVSVGLFVYLIVALLYPERFL